VNHALKHMLKRSWRQGTGTACQEARTRYNHTAQHLQLKTEQAANVISAKSPRRVPLIKFKLKRPVPHQAIIEGAAAQRQTWLPHRAGVGRGRNRLLRGLERGGDRGGGERLGRHKRLVRRHAQLLQRVREEADAARAVGPVVAQLRAVPARREPPGLARAAVLLSLFWESCQAALARCCSESLHTVGMSVSCHTQATLAHLCCHTAQGDAVAAQTRQGRRGRQPRRAAPRGVQPVLKHVVRIGAGVAAQARLVLRARFARQSAHSPRRTAPARMLPRQPLPLSVQAPPPCRHGLASRRRTARKPRRAFFMSGQAMPVYVKSRGSRRRAFSPGCANGQTVQSWQKRLEQGSTCAAARARRQTAHQAAGAHRRAPSELARTLPHLGRAGEQASWPRSGQTGRCPARIRQVSTDKVCPAKRPPPAIEPSKFTLHRR